MNIFVQYSNVRLYDCDFFLITVNQQNTKKDIVKGDIFPSNYTSFPLPLSLFTNTLFSLSSSDISLLSFSFYSFFLLLHILILCSRSNPVPRLAFPSLCPSVWVSKSCNTSPRALLVSPSQNAAGENVPVGGDGGGSAGDPADPSHHPCLSRPPCSGLRWGPRCPEGR